VLFADGLWLPFYFARLRCVLRLHFFGGFAEALEILLFCPASVCAEFTFS
jgi:hypothetical protein